MRIWIEKAWCTCDTNPHSCMLTIVFQDACYSFAAHACQGTGVSARQNEGGHSRMDSSEYCSRCQTALAGIYPQARDVCRSGSGTRVGLCCHREHGCRPSSEHITGTSKNASGIRVTTAGGHDGYPLRANDTVVIERSPVDRNPVNRKQYDTVDECPPRPDNNAIEPAPTYHNHQPDPPSDCWSDNSCSQLSWSPRRSGVPAEAILCPLRL